MPVHISLSAAMLGRSLRLGPLRFTPYGLAAAVGLISAMALARRCALRAGVDPETTWDAGLFAIFSCFVSSRLLLAMGSPEALRRYPLLLLSLPSLTFGGIALAALASVIYLRRKRLALLPALDLLAAPAALLAAFLELGHWADGSEAGTPTHLPWGVAVAGAPGTLRLHPVALYGVGLSLALTLWLWTRLPPVSLRASGASASRASAPCPGEVTSLGLMAGGLGAFALDMLSAPPAGARWLEPGQWIALAVMLAGALVWALRPLGSAHASHSHEVLSPTHSPLHMEVH